LSVQKGTIGCEFIVQKQFVLLLSPYSIL